MTNSNIRLRTAEIKDAEELLNIYKPYVEKTAISFEDQVPDVREFQNRIARILQKHPYLIAEDKGEILGYAYANDFVGRTAYEHSSELTIYLKTDKRNMGIGPRLYSAIEEICRLQNVTNLYACIGYPDKEDEYLTKNSAQFHEHLGFRLVGKFYNCGCKFGRWYHMIWMEKIIGIHEPVPRPFIPFPELDKHLLQNLGIE